MPAWRLSKGHVYMDVGDGVFMVLKFYCVVDVKFSNYS